jgi:hypothetical protein
MQKRILKISLLLTALATVAVVAFGGLANAAQLVAQTPPAQSSQTSPHPVRLAGTISSVASGSLILAAKQANYTVSIDANTWIVVQQNGAAAQGSIADIVAGKPAVVAGMTTSDPTIVDARIVAQGRFRGALGATKGAPGQSGNGARPARPAIARYVASGTVTAINGSTITLKGAVVPQVIVQTTADTVVLNNGFASLSTLKVGDTVQVLGQPVKPASAPAQPTTTPTPGSPRTLPASRTINGWAIRVDSGSNQLVVGRVTNVSGTTVTIKTPAGKKSVTLTVDSSTGYKTLSKAKKTITFANGSLSDITNGSTLIVEASPGASGNAFTADAVIVVQSNVKPK